MKKIGLMSAPHDSFGQWLYKNMLKKDVGYRQVANDLQISQTVIYKHVKGQWPPTFAHTIGYCWYFGQLDKVEEVWEMVEERRYGF